MRNIKILFLLIASLNLWGCMKDLKMDEFSDAAISSTISVKVTMPEGYNYSTAGLTVKLSDPGTGLVFSGITDQNGVASIRVAHGSYIATTETKYSTGKIIYIFNGVSEKIRVTPQDAESVSSAIALNASKTGQIIIKEFYYGGCTNPLTNKSYTLKDTYFKLYNNSDEVAYLDSLCVGIADPSNAPSNGVPSVWVKLGTTELRDSVPNLSMGWMFPGNGKEHPLQPGEEVVVCLNGIDHTIACPTSINLANPKYWAIYDPIMTTGQTPPIPGMKSLQGFWKVGATSSYIISISGPALFIYSMGGKTPAEFVSSTRTSKPGSPDSKFDCLMVDKNLILDGVECFRKVTDSKRLRPEIDNGYAITDGSGTGQCIHRKVDPVATLAAGNRTVYMDTNNSTNDFEMRPRPSLSNN